MFSSKDLFFTPAVSTGYTVSKSLRFRSSATAYLNRTFGTPTSASKWTKSFWIKRGTLGTVPILAAQTVSASANYAIQFNADNTFTWQFSNTLSLITTQVFRDPSAWYHIVLVWDSANATAANKAIIYVNNVQVTNFSTDNRASVSATQNAWETAGTGYISYTNGTNNFDGYMAEVNFIDGDTKLPTAFGAYDTNGVWQPAAYTGTYGNNGYYLKFTTVGATSGSNTGYGQDFSGNGNYWTTNNFGTTSTATTYDSMLDSPTNATGDIGNYAVANPLSVNSATLTDGNLNVSVSGVASAVATAAGTVGVSSGKWYWETTVVSNTTSDLMIGVVDITRAATARNYSNANTWYYYGANGNKYISGTGSSYGASYTNNDVIGIALDMDSGTIAFYKNGTSQGTAASTGISGLTIVPVWGNGTSGGAQVYAANFGQRPFAYTAPSGYSALNTQNLTTPTISNGASYMAAVTYTGDSSASRTITTSSTNSGNNPLGTSFQPDFVWIKSRTNPAAGYYHLLMDVVRGAASGFYKTLYSNATDAEDTYPGSTYGGVSAFTTSGFSLANVGSNYWGNNNTNTYVAWQWKAGGTGVSNTSGSITSTVSANTTAGFSVVTYTGTGANATVGHGLGVAPSMIIVKRRVDAPYSWPVYHSGLSGGANDYLILDGTQGKATNIVVWNNTNPTSTVFSIGTDAFINASTKTYVAYCFAAVAGYSAFGSYTGNGSTDGVFVYTGFRPRYLLLKIYSSGGGSWQVKDTSRDTYNAATTTLYPNLSNAEASDTAVDILSNGFKLRASTGENASGVTTIYAAFAENPFKISRAR